MIRILSFFLLVAASAATAQQIPGLYKVSGVAANDTLNVRTGPSAQTEIIGTLAPYATGIEVTDLSDDRAWGRINLEERTGWVAMRFLDQLPLADLGGVPIPLRCYGTEPFWDLALLDRETTEFSLFGSFEVGFDPLEIVRPANLIGRWAAIGRQGDTRATIILSQRTCSDGMSDRLFGYEVNMVYEDVQGSAVYSGCCSVATNR